MLSKLFRKTEPHSQYDLDEVLQLAEAGRRAAIYDRATRLYAYWYLQLRGDEEVARALRYTKPLSCLSVWAGTSAAIDVLAADLRECMRANDLAAYLNNGHFVVLLNETGAEGARVALDRILRACSSDVRGAAVSFPADGETFDALLEAAKARAALGAAA